MASSLKTMRALIILAAVAAVAASSLATSPPSPDALKAVLQTAADQTARQFNCTIAIAYKDAQTAVSAVNAGSPTGVGERFVWGSVTKTLTGSTILRLMEEGKLALDDPIAMHVDPFLAKIAASGGAAREHMNYSSVEDLWGKDIAGTSIRMLGKMQSGIPDFDTAHGFGENMTDPFRATLYANPKHSYGPTEILAVPWVYQGHLNEVGGHSYSSTNFILLGLIAASKMPGVDTWETFDQVSPLPPALQQALKGAVFGTKGAPSI